LLNWSWLMFHVTFGNCFVNSSESLKGMSKPVSKYAFRTTGSVPQVGPAATAVADGVATAVAEGVATAVAEGVTAAVAEGVTAAVAEGVTTAVATAVATAVTDGVATEGAAGVDVAVDGAVVGDGATDVPGAQALAMIASNAKLVARIPGLRTDRPRVNDPSRLALNI
jgi:hypothetical protein